MQINIALTDNNPEQAEILRGQWYPSASSQQIRDSLIFNEVIDRFQGDPVEVLADYFRNDDDSRTAQRRITLRQDTNERLRTIASVANKPIAATLRALIAHAVDNAGRCHAAPAAQREDRPAGKAACSLHENLGRHQAARKVNGEALVCHQHAEPESLIKRAICVHLPTFAPPLKPQTQEVP